MQAPKQGKKYKEVLNRGCGVFENYFGEYDCIHDYDWSCDDCPIVTEKYKKILGGENEEIEEIEFF